MHTAQEIEQKMENIVDEFESLTKQTEGINKLPQNKLDEILKRQNELRKEYEDLSTELAKEHRIGTYITLSKRLNQKFGRNY